MPSTVADEWLPALSSMLAVADRLSPSPVITESSGHRPSIPESASLHVQWTVTSPWYQPFAFGAVVGAPVIAGAVSSTSVPLTDGAPPSPRVTGVVQVEIPERASEQTKLTATSALYQPLELAERSG